MESEMLTLVNPKVLDVNDIDQAIEAIPFIRVHNAFGIHASPDMRKTEEACANLDHTHKPRFFPGLEGEVQSPEDVEIGVDGPLVHSQQLGCFCRIDIDVKTRGIFFDPEGTDFSMFQYCSGISEIFFCSRVFKKKNVHRI